MKILKTLAICLLSSISFSSLAQQNESLLWEVSGNNLEKPSYVFGTIHMICEDDYIMTETISNTLKNVDAFYAEINFADPSNALIMQQMMLSETPLSKRLSADKYAKLKTLLNDVVELDINQFENFNDSAIASMITFKSFPCTDFKMYEMELLQIAVAGNKELGGLETAAQQMKTLSKSLTMDAVFEMLNELKTKVYESTTEMVNLYKTQNVSELYNFMKKSSYMTRSEERRVGKECRSRR